MKRTLALAAILLFLCTPLFADDIFENTDLGAKVDIPNVFKSGNHSIGAEVSITDITEDWNDGSQAYIKYTWNGTLFGDK